MTMETEGNPLHMLEKQIKSISTINKRKNAKGGDQKIGNVANVVEIIIDIGEETEIIRIEISRFPKSLSKRMNKAICRRKSLCL